METLYGTAKELAEQLDVIPATIRRWVKKNNIKYAKEGQDMLIDLTSFWMWYYNKMGISLTTESDVEAK